MTTAIPPAPPRLEADAIMADLRARARDALRDRLRRQGARELGDREIFEAVDALFRDAFETNEAGALLLAEMLAEIEDWDLDTALRLRSHRPLIGRLIVFLKRRLLLPATRWLFEYSRDNFERQRRINRLLFACLQRLAVEQVQLRRELARARQTPAAGAGPPIQP